MEWPKTGADSGLENGFLTFDKEKQLEVPELTAEIMERLAGCPLAGFHVKGYPVTDELLAPFAGHKSMANFGVEDGALTDACFPVFSAMPKLRYLLLDGNTAINGSGLVRPAKLQAGSSDPGPHRAGRCRAAPGGLHPPNSPTSRSTIPPLPMRACWPLPATTTSSGGPCAIHPGTDGALLPSFSGRRPKSPSSWTNRLRRNAAGCCPLSLPK